MARTKGPKIISLPHGTPFGTPPTVRDARAFFRNSSTKLKPDEQFRQMFVRHRRHTAATHPFLSDAQRHLALQELQQVAPSAFKRSSAAPIPGGIGYGMYYSQSFHIAFSEGTALFWEIVCPSVPGGNVTDTLYLTGMNRASLGVEALVKYNGQSEPRFTMYDWSIGDEPKRWQPEVLFSKLVAYLREDGAHGGSYQVLPVMNMTYQIQPNTWVNQVCLLNHDTDNWDLVYQNSYAATVDAQHGAWVGTWGPIVETFQDTYSGTNGMGALNTQLSTHLNGQWGVWSPLRQADSQVRVDNKGFLPVFLDANSSWVIRS